MFGLLENKATSKYLEYIAFIFFQELKRVRAKAAAALKSLQEKLEEKLKTELEKKVKI